MDGRRVKSLRLHTAPPVEVEQGERSGHRGDA
jgi:hypothetical protein